MSAATKMSEAILKKKFASCGQSIAKFVESELRLSKGHRESVEVILAQLIMMDSDAASQLAKRYVAEVWGRMRYENLDGKLSESQVARKIKRAEAWEKYGDLLRPAEQKVKDALRGISAERAEKLDNSPIAWRRFLSQTLPELSKLGIIDFAHISIAKPSRSRKILNSLEDKRAAIAEVVKKASSFDRMVEALDAIKVGGKLLGDCTGADLLREAVALEEFAAEATAQSVFYRQLASIVGKTKTVREAADRAGVVGLLTSRFHEPDFVCEGNA